MWWWAEPLRSWAGGFLGFRMSFLGEAYHLHSVFYWYTRVSKAQWFVGSNGLFIYCPGGWEVREHRTNIFLTCSEAIWLHPMEDRASLPAWGTLLPEAQVSLWGLTLRSSSKPKYLPKYYQHINLQIKFPVPDRLNGTSKPYHLLKEV